MTIRTSRLAALATAPLLVIGALAAAAPAQAAPERTAESHSAAVWLTDALTDGVFHNPQYDFDDYGVTIDALLALDYVGGYADDVQDIADALADGIGSYTGTAFGEAYAGSIAKSAVAARAAGRDVTSFGGRNLIADLEARVRDEGVMTGRVVDKSADGDFANVFGQAFAAEALDAAGSERTDAVTDFLLEQQCPAGGFRLVFSRADADDQSCTLDSQAETDATAQAIRSLESQDDDGDVGAALVRARTWLLGQQKADGGFGGGAATEAENTNSSALAALALQSLGEDDAAAKAAAWVAERQVTNVHGCGTYVAIDRGAVAYNDADFTAAETDGIGVEQAGQWFRATAPAAAALSLYRAPAPKPAATLSVVRTPAAADEFVPAGSTQKLAISGLDPKERFCLNAGQLAGGQADAAGKAVISTEIRTSTGPRTISVTGSRAARAGSYRFYALAKKTLSVSLGASTVARNGKVKVTVSGLAPGEPVRIRYRSVVRTTGTASATGTFTYTLSVGSVTGKKYVYALGKFDNRTGVKTLTVK